METLDYVIELNKRVEVHLQSGPHFHWHAQDVAEVELPLNATAHQNFYHWGVL